MASLDPVALVRGVYDALNRGDAAAAARYYAHGAVNHGQVVGRNGMRAVFEGLLSTFPDIRFELGECVVQDDRVVCLLVMTGSHLGRPTTPTLFQGALTGVEPTGRRVEVRQAHEFRIEAAEIVEHGAIRDDLGMLRQLGLYEPPG